MEDPTPVFERASYWKFVLGFLGMIAIALIILSQYDRLRAWEQGEAANQIVQSMDAKTQADYARAAQDAYGGATPQDTLRMYITAVEKGDYELASKYFIFKYQAQQLQNLQNSKTENIQNMIFLVRQSLVSKGSYSADKKEFAIEKPVLVDFLLYPNGIWKIVEI